MTRTHRQRSPGWWYPWLLVGGLGIVVIVNGVMAYFAVSTWPGLETESHYYKGLAYNENLAAARDQERRGWTMDLDFVPGRSTTGRDRMGQLAVRFEDRLGTPITDLAARAQLTRPTREGFDRTIALNHVGGGVYTASVSLPLAGQWQVRILAHRNDQTFQETRRLLVSQ